MKMVQLVEQIVDISEWRRDEEFAVYPEGARDKTLVYCPSPSPYSFLEEGHRYLFKRSSHRYPEQFWVEIFAYRLGEQMQVPVPPAFVAYDSKAKQSATLIRWFLNKRGMAGSAMHISGGDLCQAYIPNFDRKKGVQHNFGTVALIFTEYLKKHPLFVFQDNWKKYWARAFVFDALIGNTDRHQDNWGIIIDPFSDINISPVFDNGTSMGHEVFSNKFPLFEDCKRLEKYVLKGEHHMKWALEDTARMEHYELLKKLIEKYPEMLAIMLDCLKKASHETFKKILSDLVAFNVPVRLTVERADFMLKLIEFRHRRLLNKLEN